MGIGIKKMFITICFLSINCLIISCGTMKINGKYCGRKNNAIFSNLAINDGNTFLLQVNYRQHKSWSYYYAGNYIIDGRSLTLIANSGGTKVDSLTLLNNTDTTYGFIKDDRIILLQNLIISTKQVLKKRAQCNAEF